MISYAQNFEDVILWRALKEIPHGRYIDIGGQDPIIDSVSKAFYDHGWRGVHVEPIPEYAEKIRASRPEELVLEIALDLSKGAIKMHSFPDTGLSTGVKAIAELHHEDGLTSNIIEVKTDTLESVLNDMGEDDIHWMKVDVEGMEQNVLESWYDAQARPWIVVVESTKPNSPEETECLWEVEVTSRGYVFMYFDGLNRYYLHKNQMDLCNYFGLGPNVFDDFVVADTSSYKFVDNVVAYTSKVRAESDRVIIKLQQKISNKTQQFDSEVVRLNGHIHHIQTMLNLAEGRLENRDQRIESLLIDLRNKREATEKHSVERAQLNADKDQLKKQVKDLKSALSFAKDRVEKKKKKINSLRSKILEERNALIDDRLNVERQIGGLEQNIKQKNIEYFAHIAAAAEMEKAYLNALKVSKALKKTNDELVSVHESMLRDKVELEASLHETRRVEASSRLKYENLHQQITDFRSSTSWKITSPMRFVRRGFRAEAINPLAANPIVGPEFARPSWAFRAKIRALKFVRKYPSFKPFVLLLLSPFSDSRAKLVEFGQANAQIGRGQIVATGATELNWNLLADPANVKHWKKRLKRKQ